MSGFSPSGLSPSRAARGGFKPSRTARVSVALVLAALVLLTDQISKALVREAFTAGRLPVAVIPGVIDFDFVANTGVSFGFAAGFGSASVILAVVVSVAAAAYLIRARVVSWPEVIGLGLLVGGAVGNAIDRAVFGFVTDFIATAFIEFPVFNIADIGITCGVAIALVGFLLLSPATDPTRGREASGADDDGEVRGL